MWIASALAWMLIGHHQKDWIGLPDEAGTLSKIADIPPGNYGFPYAADRKQCSDPEFRKKWEQGPAGMLQIFPKNISMGRNMILTFLTYLVVSVLIGYVAWSVRGSIGGDKLETFRVLGTVGVLSYAFAFIPGNIWFAAYPRAILMNIIDGVVYGLITGAAFAFLWPDVKLALPGL